MTFAGFLSKRDHHKSLFGCRQLVPYIGKILKHHLIFLMVSDHSKSSHIVYAKEGTRVVACPINEMHFDRFSCEQSSRDWLFDDFLG